MDEFDDDVVDDISATIDPFYFKEHHWSMIRQLTILIMKRDDIPYLEAVVFAYVEWVEMAQTSDTRH